MTSAQLGNLLLTISESRVLGQKDKAEVMLEVVRTFMSEDMSATIPQNHQIQSPATGQSQDLPAGNVMIPTGFLCECDQCNVAVYRIISDVHENMNKKDFVACFKPLGNAPELKMPLDTFADSNGNLAIDCPLCKGTKSLWIKGKGDIPFNDIPEVNK